MQVFDVVILGGGPAGCAAALSLRHEEPALSVAILEASAYEEPRIGETLPPNIDALLVHLRVWDQFVASGPLAAFASRSCWGSPTVGENEFIFQKQGKGWHLDRRVFDRMLATEAERAGAHLFLNTRARDHHGGRFIIDATGRNSSFAVEQGARRLEADRLAGCFLFFDAPDSRPFDGPTLVEAFEHGWTYSAALPGGQLAAAIFSDSDILRDLNIRTADCWIAALDRTPETQKRLAQARPAGAPFTRSAASRRLDIVAGEDWIAAGDAASTFDPLSSQGIFKALRGGIFASYAALDALRGDRTGVERYRRFVRDEYEEYLEIRAAYYAEEQRWPDAPFWKRRQMRVGAPV